MAAPPEAVSARPRRWPRRLLIGVNIFLAVCILAAGSGYAYLRWRFGQLDKITFGRSILHPQEKLLKEDVPGDPMNVLLVGSDTRENLTGADCKRNCRDENGNLVTGKRSDTIMVLHVDPQQKKAAILSIPRDLWVPIAGTRHNQRINTAYEKDEATLIDTIKGALGININHFVSVDFIGFRNLVNAVNGVPIYVPAPARDFYSDLRIPNPGCVTLDGAQALGWVRSRHYQYYESGRWRSDPRSDFGRILRQQDFIRRLMKRSISKGIRNPFTLNRLVGIAVKNVHTDSEMSTKDIFSLGRRFKSLDPQSVTMLTLPVVEARIGGADVLKIKRPEAQEIVDLFNGVNQNQDGGAAAVNVLPSTVRVRTLNGSGVNGIAGKTAAALTTYGFQNAGTGDADGYRYPETVIKYGRGQIDKARALQRYLKAGATLQQDNTLSVDVVLYVGRDFSGVVKPAAPGATTTVPATAATTTTVAPSPVPVPKGAPPQPQC